MSLTTDPNHPDLTHGVDSQPVGQAKVYLVLSEEERKKGFQRPLRRGYKHVGVRPKYPTRPLTAEEANRYAAMNYVLYEEYPESERPLVGRYWTEAQLRSGCGGNTTMALELAETYARHPKFYGSTYCTGCGMHRPVGEFVWLEDGERVGS